MGYFGREDIFGEMTYSFETENPGLQQVYDAVVELGVTEPMVPTWLPGNPELKELDIVKMPMAQNICATFLENGNEIVYKLSVYGGEPAHEYYKDDTHYESHEREGTTYYITQNNNWWSVVWARENIECFLTLECTEDTLWKILDSIHVTEAD